MQRCITGPARRIVHLSARSASILHTLPRSCQPTLVPTRQALVCQSTLRYSSGPVASLKGMRAASAGPATLTGSPQASVAIFTTKGCGYCARAKDALSSANISFVDVELSRNLGLLAQVKQFTGQRTVPQVFVGGEFVGGAQEVLQLLEQGELQKRVSQAQHPPLPAELQEAADTALREFQEGQREEATVPGMEQEEVQALTQLADRMAEHAPAGTHWYRLKPHRATLKLRQAELWVSQQQLPPALSSHKPLQLLTHLQQAHLLGTVCGPCDLHTPLAQLPLANQEDTLVRLVSQSPTPKLGRPLNVQFAWMRPARPASQVAEGLRQRILALYDTHLAADGRAVDYTALRQDPDFARYVAATAELQRVDVSGLDRAQRMCFFINLYNALIIHALAIYGPETNTLARLRWFASIKYRIGSQPFSSFDIEHGVLRGNAASPIALPVLLGQPQWAKPYFKPEDPRLRLVIEPVDPRIHFALVCGAKSCPPIKLYTPELLEEGLASAASAFCEGEVQVDAEQSLVRLSSIFKWYAGDFGRSTKERLSYLLPYLGQQQRTAMQQLLAGSTEKIKIEYLTYDWSMNSA